MLQEWFHKVGDMSATSFPSLRQTFDSADYVDGFSVFDVGGNRYRVATVIHFDKHRMYVRRVMTHIEYDRNDWKKNECRDY